MAIYKDKLFDYVQVKYLPNQIMDKSFRLYHMYQDNYGGLFHKY